MPRTKQVTFDGLEFTITSLSLDECRTFLQANKDLSNLPPTERTIDRFDENALTNIVLVSLNKSKGDEKLTAESFCSQYDPAVLSFLSVQIRRFSGMPVMQKELEDAEKGERILVPEPGEPGPAA